jgi:hypothetical protein
VQLGNEQAGARPDDCRNMPIPLKIPREGFRALSPAFDKYWIMAASKLADRISGLPQLIVDLYLGDDIDRLPQ